MPKDSQLAKEVLEGVAVALQSENAALREKLRAAEAELRSFRLRDNSHPVGTLKGFGASLDGRWKLVSQQPYEGDRILVCLEGPYV
jgi:hypothetical protein